jgi:hypothetical protein
MSSLVLLAPLLAGCPNTDPAVFVDPSLSSPSLALSPSGGLGQGIQGGGFSIDLHLGARAAGPSTVTLGTFSVLDAELKGAIVPSLDVSAEGTSFSTGSAVVEPDSDLLVSFLIPPATGTLPSTTVTELCASAGVVIGANIEDSLRGTSVPFYSSPFQTTGCPTSP